MPSFDNSTPTNPPLTQSDAVASLLSLSLADATPAHAPALGVSPQPASNGVAGNFADAPSSLNSHSSAAPSTSVGSGLKTHRRLASTGKTRRRLSDAREAAVRPSPATLQASAAALSLASLSLSSSPPSSHAHISTSLTGVSKALAPVPPTTTVPLNDESNIPQHTDAHDERASSAIPISHGKNGKKRGIDHKCESCSKIYRHPSCLIKHRWEHTPHWREASKFVLSKHQQVQLLEAAAILSHLSPTASGGKSLPEDRSLWPSFLSGGSLPPPEPSFPSNGSASEATQPGTISSSPYPTYPTSSSVPASSALGGGFKRSTSAGPRLHDYSVPASAGATGVTQLRPGLVGVSTGGTGVIVAPTAPMPVPNAGRDATSSFAGYHSAGSYAASSYQSAAASNSYAGAQGWSLPRSSLRSESDSRSRSASRSDEESVDVDVEGLEEYQDHSGPGYGGRYGFTSRGMWKHEDDDFSVGFSVREEDEEEGVVVVPAGGKMEQEWDGMELEMDMD